MVVSCLLWSLLWQPLYVSMLLHSLMLVLMLAGGMANMDTEVQVRLFESAVRLFKIPAGPPSFLEKMRKTSRAQLLADYHLPMSTAEEA